MEDRHRKILQSSFVFLTKNIHNVEEVCDHLMTDDVLTAGMFDTIKNKSPTTAKIRELLSTLPRRGKKAYESFINALIESNNEDAADYLREKEGLKKDNKKDEKKKLDEKKEEEKRKKEDEDWPSRKGISMVQKKEIQISSEESLKIISESKMVYYMTGKNKGKVIVISNVPVGNIQKACENSSECGSSQSQDCEEDCISSYRRHIDFDESSIQDLFKHMKFEAKVSSKIKDQTGEEMKASLRKELDVEEDYNSVVVVIISGGMDYEAGEIYDKNRTIVPRDDILQIIREAEKFKGKPKIVIIRTYSFESTVNENKKLKTEGSFDTLDADKTSNTILTGNPNHDDMFVVSSFPKTKSGPWVAGENMQGSYFIQALIHVFKNMAHEKSLLELMEKVNDVLHNALVPITEKGETTYKKTEVADVVVLMHSVDKDLYLFPCQCGIPEIAIKSQCTETKPTKETNVKAEVKTAEPILTQDIPAEDKLAEWPDLSKPGCSFKKRDLKMSDKKIYNQIISKGKEIYRMTRKDKGRIIVISNVCAPAFQSPGGEDENRMEKERCAKCRNNIDFDNTNIVSALKAFGWKSSKVIKNMTGQEVKESLKCVLDEIDSDKDSDYDSLVVLIMSGKMDCEAEKIYDIEGQTIAKKEIQQIITQSQHFKGKPKIVFIQTYNFQETNHPYDEKDTARYDILMKNDPNLDDLFVVSSYPRIDEGPWMIGDNMNGSYFIHGLVHILTYHAYNKSFIDLMKELQKCLMKAVVPVTKVEKEGNKIYTEETERKHVADVVLLEYSEQKELYLFPGYDHEHLLKGMQNVDLSASLRGNPVCQPSS